jgi:polyhydroxybutyrate depolymerase
MPLARTQLLTTAILLALAVNLAAAPQSSFRAEVPAADTEHHIRVNGTDRLYFLHIPKSLPSGKAAPLILVFHGGGGHAVNMPKFTQFDPLADQEGFFVAYPDSFNKSWNDGRGLSPADDVGFVRVLIEQLQHSYKIDHKRIYAAGISNGGFFSIRLACDLSHKIAAVAAVAATMPEPLVPECKPSAPVSVMFIHGTKDPLVHINGGPIGVRRDRGSAVSLREAAEFWRNRDRTSPNSVAEEVSQPARDSTQVHREIYGGGRDGTEVIVYIIEGGGHTWPGGSQYLPVFLVGKVSHKLDATQAIWDFFKQHHR